MGRLALIPTVSLETMVKEKMTPPFRVLIVDDESLGRERIRTLVAAHPGVEIAGECKQGREAVEAIKTLRPDLVFLDIQMPEMTGFDVIQAVGPAHMPAVIFVTAYDRHALKAFEVHALDYLLKPFEVDRFNEALNRAVEFTRNDARDAFNQKFSNLLLDVKPTEQWLKRVMIKARSRMYFIQCEDIDWIEAAGNYAAIFAQGKEHLIRQTMTQLEKQLNPAQFMRIHRSTIINIDRVEAFYPMASGEYEVQLNNGKKLTLSRSYRHALDKFSP